MSFLKKDRQTVGAVPDFEELFGVFVSNVRLCPNLGQALAENLKVTPQSIMDLPVGFWPAHGSFVFAERDHRGQIIGLTERYFPSGKKLALKGSKRGLVYNPADFPAPASHKNEFVRTEKAGVPCPICGKKSGCLVSDDDIHDPSCVLCPHESEGAVETRKTGYLHRRHTNFAGPDTPSSALPVLVVEGASDVLAGKDLDRRVIGKPSASDGDSYLVKLLAGEDVVVFGDNDKTGRGGAETTFRALRPVCRSVRKAFPPEGRGKDLRTYAPSREEFEAHVDATGVWADTSDILPSASPRQLALGWLNSTHVRNNHRLLHHVCGAWYEHNGTFYDRVEPEELQERLADYFDGREAWSIQPKGERIVKRLEANERLVKELLFALRSRCHVKTDPGEHEPFLLATGKRMDLARAVIFRNGIYHVSTDKLMPLTPAVFLTSTLPYDYRSDNTCPESLGLIHSALQGDDEAVALLQEYAGYCLTADNSFESLLFLIGLPGSGKGTIVTMLEAMLGPARCGTFELSDLTNRFARARLLGRYLVTFSEDVVGRRDSGKILAALKRLTGNDSVCIEEKFAKGFDAKLFCRAVYSGNELPIFDDASRSLSRRLNILKFGHVPDRPDHTLKRRLVREAPGLAVWALQGLRRLLENQRFTRPKSSGEFLRDAEKLSNPLGTAFEECVTFFPGGFATKDLLFDLHVAVCTCERMPILARNVFFAKFKARYGAKISDVDKRGPVDPATKKRSWGIEGVSLLPTAYDYLQKI